MNIKRFYTTSFFVLALLFSSFIKNNTEEINTDKFIVVLDAGHGGHDPGNLGNGYLEKNIALNIVLKVGKILEANPNIKVIYTRNNDTFVDLFVRGEIANKANADLFVSVHCDSHSSDAHGAGTFVLGLHANKQNFEIAKKENSVIYLEDNYETRYSDYDINSPESVIGLTIMQEEFLDQSISLAKSIQDNFSNKLKRKDRKVKQAGFIVLHQTFMPSVLVETGFLTNDDEGAYLNSKKGQSEMGNAIASAILNYKKGVQSNIADVSSQVSTPTPDPEKVEDIASVEKTIDEPTVVLKKEPKTVEVVKGQPKKPIEEKIVATDKKVEKLEQEVSKVIEKEKPKTTDVVKPTLQKVDEKIVKKIPPSEKKKEEVVMKTKPEPKKTVTNIVFKVQLMASTKKKPLTPQQFNGLNVLSEEQYKSFTRYMYGNADTYEAAELLKTNADKKGYTTSYIVAYKDGVRITVQQAIKYASEY